VTPYLLAVDVGTLAARAGVFDAGGALFAAASASFTLHRPLEHHAVYRMDDIWAAVCRAVRDARAQAPAGEIGGIAFDATSGSLADTDTTTIGTPSTVAVSVFYK